MYKKNTAISLKDIFGGICLNIRERNPANLLALLDRPVIKL